MKKYFITGLIILLPLTLTIAIVLFVFNLLTVPFLGIVKAVFDHYHLFEKGFFFLNANQIQNILAQILIFISLFIIVIALGYIARWFFFRTFIKCAEYMVKRIPIVNVIYKTCQDVIHTIFTEKTSSFKQVVLVHFPHKDTYSIGLITREDIPCLEGTSHSDSVAVFVPTTPNPTSGFLIMFKRSDLIYLDMKVEDAFKYVISCGMLSPEFHTISKEEALKLSKGI